AVFTDDPNFIARSLVHPNLDRDLTKERQFTQELYDAQRDSLADYNPYLLGSAMASWLWAIADAGVVSSDRAATADTERDIADDNSLDGSTSAIALADRTAIARAIILAIGDLPANKRKAGCAEFGADYRLADFLDAIVRHLPAELTNRACTLLDARLEGDFRNVPSCGIAR
ncbi:MAG: hypothetical protein V2A73_12975, partial [Pseudomonadota bacterium]